MLASLHVECYRRHMERRDTPRSAAELVVAAIEGRGITTATLSEATGIPLPVLRERLDSSSEFTVDELGRVGGFLRIHPADLIGASL